MRDQDRQHPYRNGGPRRSNVDFKAIAAQLAEEEAQLVDSGIESWQTRIEHDDDPRPAAERPTVSDIPIDVPPPSQP